MYSTKSIQHDETMNLDLYMIIIFATICIFFIYYIIKTYLEQDPRGKLLLEYEKQCLLLRGNAEQVIEIIFRHGRPNTLITDNQDFHITRNENVQISTRFFQFQINTNNFVNINCHDNNSRVSILDMYYNYITKELYFESNLVNCFALMNLTTFTLETNNRNFIRLEYFKNRFIIQIDRFFVYINYSIIDGFAIRSIIFEWLTEASLFKIPSPILSVVDTRFQMLNERYLLTMHMIINMVNNATIN